MKYKLDSMKIKFVDYSNELNFNELGNTADHVSPALKNDFTLDFHNKNKFLFNK